MTSPAAEPSWPLGAPGGWPPTLADRRDSPPWGRPEPWAGLLSPPSKPAAPQAERYDDRELRADLRFYENVREKPYPDSRGNRTIGVGHNLEADPQMLERLAALEQDGLPPEEIERLLDRDIQTAIAGLDKELPWWRTLSPRRQDIMVNLAFNMDAKKLAKFTDSLAAMQAGDFETASDELLNSRWAQQVGPRRTQMVEQMRTGERHVPKEPTG